MTEALYIFLAFAVGFGSAFQIAMLGLLQRDRGSFEATWINMLSSSAVFLVAVVILAVVRSDRMELPAPFDKTYFHALLVALTVVALALSMRGFHPALALVGVFGFVYVLAAAFLGPKIGIALYIAVVTAGTLIGGVGLDHYGAFGGTVIRVDSLKVAGLAFLMVGVVLIRGR
jgi:transporter family-2 protein